jgi:tRNA A-37 threonylcarbamoyl transferase component Bud32
MVLKRYNIKGPAHYLRRCLRPSRAAVSWKNAHRLHFLGVATPQPVAFAETRHGFLRSTALFVMRYENGPDLACQLGMPAVSSAEIDRMAAAFCDLVVVLAHNRLSHGDFKATNFIVGEQGLTLLDLDGMARHWIAKRHVRALSRDLRRFVHNWDGQPALQQRFSDQLNKRLPLPFRAFSK